MNDSKNTNNSEEERPSVVNSTLTPNAKEFIPRNANYNSNTRLLDEPTSSNGAVRKYGRSNYVANQNYNWNKSKNQFQNGRNYKWDENKRQNNYSNNWRSRENQNFDYDMFQSNSARSFNNGKYYENDYGNNSQNRNYGKKVYTSKNYSRRGPQKNYNYNDGHKGNLKNENFTLSSEYDDGNKNSDKEWNYKEKDKPKKLTNSKSSNFQRRNKNFDKISQRERLQELIMHNQLECLVCYEKLKQKDKIWYCVQCYHIIHLQCIIKWADSSKLDTGWRCPACQNISSVVPKNYFCYCGKVKDPSYGVGKLPHSCDEVCSRKGRSCLHKCTLICHPGPCPDCSAMVTRSCFCGSTSAMIKCSSRVPFTCNSVCNKILNCGFHKCTRTCHDGNCDPCKEIVKQECYCYKQCRIVPCTVVTCKEKYYSCGEKCEKLLKCNNHKCQAVCHEGKCETCDQDPELITTCPCGKKKLENVRKSCLDPIPSCGQICGKFLKCGQPGYSHTCKAQCHGGECPPCSLTTFVKCRCGSMDKELPCAKLTSRPDDARCQKKCTKKRSCGKHKCNQFCCIDIEHLCPLPCNRTLFCGNHRCELTCHKGRCPPCLHSSFEELYCECGSSVIMPPVPCGTRPPVCTMPCSRPRSCGHDPLHLCHSGACPPCTVLVKKWCHGQHEQRSTIFCHQESFSCGLPCGKVMSCGRHKCVKPCHTGSCPHPCKQPCTELRPGCGHPCNLPCHDPPCPETPCRQMVKVSCDCGLRSASKVCLDLANEYQTISMSHLVTKMEEMQRGEIVDLTDLAVGKQKKNSVIKALECNDECRVVERNRRMAIALQVSGSDFQQKIVPKYSEYMRQWAKKNPSFCEYVHNKLTELVRLAKQSKQKSRSYSFETMNKEKRHFVHEYCEHFGCESAAYDPEPNRNVVATALKDKSFVPSYSLLEMIQRESGQRKVPGPQQLRKGPNSMTESVSLKVPVKLNRPPTPPAEYIDYFDDPPM